MRVGQSSRIWTIVAAFAAVVFFLLECDFFHFPFQSGFDALLLGGLILIPGFVFSNILRQQFHIELSGIEAFSLSSAFGFGFAAIAAHIFHTICWPIVAVYGILVIYLIVNSFLKKNGNQQISFFEVAKPLAFILLSTLIFFAAYNLHCFHYDANGAIVTRGLFGVDIPFLAGEIHGIQDFGSLRDLHQSAIAWNYHDWTYQLLALLSRKRTIADVALASPIVSYSLLAFSVFAVVFRFTKSKQIAYFSIAGWFLVSGLGGGELGSYALSPSFVFGSIIFLNAIFLFDILCNETRTRQRWIISAIFVFILFELSRTKLSSFLVLAVALGIAGLILLRSNRIAGIQTVIIAGISLAGFLVLNSGANPLMPTNDFLIGAPLMGYANHLSAILHLSAKSLNPVSNGFHLRWQSILIIPYFLFHFLRFVILDAKLLSAIIIFAALRKILWKEYGEIVLLIVILIPLGFLMPVVYSPAWYPLALSFYAPLVSEQAALLLAALGFGLLYRVQVTRAQRTAMGVATLVLICGFALTGHSIAKDDNAKADIVSIPLEQAMNYLSNAANDTDIVASRRFDEDSTDDESYYWYSALSGRAVVSEGAKYGSLLAAIADTNSEKGLHRAMAAESFLASCRKLLDTIYLSRDLTHVRDAITETRSTFIIEDSTNYPSPAKREELSIDPWSIGEQAFRNGEYKIWKIRK